MRYIFFGLAIITLAYIFVMYLVNPLDIKSINPRARLWGVDIYRIPSGSMKPGLNVGDFVVITTMSKNVDRGDIVVFHYPENPEVDFIMRLIGKGGDNIQYLNKRIYVNNKEAIYSNESQYDDYRIQVTEAIGDKSWNILLDKRVSPTDFSITVPDDHLFFLGDNRGNSRDSRVWGFVEKSKVVGEFKFSF